jgi:phage terminase large subunit
LIKATTALKKIASLKKKIRVIQGGQGAGKTIAVLILLINHASGQEDREILIISEELTKMRLTVIKDFVKVMKGFGIFEERRFIAGTLYRFPNGSFIKFIGLDKEDVGKGLRSDIAYFNEINKIDLESYRQVATRSKLVIADYNPDANFFVHEEVVTREDCDFITLTFEDNEFLPEGEREEILLYYEKGYGRKYDSIDPNRNNYEPINKYWANKWRVYGLGEVGSIDGVVFERFEIIDSLPEKAKLKYYGLDFGYSISKFAVVAVYYLDGKFILDELVYKNDLTNPRGAEEMKKAGYEKGLVYCDSAEPKSIQELCDNGINAIPCESKRDIKAYAIQKLNDEAFHVTARSENLINELRHYIWDEKTGKPKKTDLDHLMDAMQYAIGSEGMYNGTY